MSGQPKFRWIRHCGWLGLGLTLATCLLANGAVAQVPGRKPASSSSTATTKPAERADFRSQHFFIHTDLPAAEANELLGRLETMLQLISGYWGRPPRGIIECYVVKDLNNWPKGTLGGGEEETHGRASIGSGGGVTLTSTLSTGNGPKREIVDAKSIVYASADRGTPQHESVHAYCGQNFGRTGPVWYSEGMAEMGQYWRTDGDKGVHVHEVVEKYLQGSEIKSLNAIVNNEEKTGDSWENYAWRWALCHLLAFNPNYADRFRPLGLGILQDSDGATFEAVYGDMANEISFEYRFFLEHMRNGFRVDLAAIDWKKKFVPLRGATPLTSKVLADHGWQPTQAVVAKDEEYEYTATGTWQLSKSGEKLTAKGDSQGNGRLEAAVMDDFKLTDPVELDARGTFKPPADGKLFVRCRDAWNELSDNKGTVTFKVKLKK